MTQHNQNEPSIKIIGRNIRRWRVFRELSGENLAHAVGLEKGQISKIENGNSPDVSLRKLEEIAGALDLTLDQLLSSSPQTIINLTQHATDNGINFNGINYGTQNNSADIAIVNELRQQLKIKDDHIKFLQERFPRM